MTFYFTLSVLHHLAAFTLIGLLAAEFALLRERMVPRDVIRLARLDIAYGLTFAVLLAIGLSRVFFGLKGADYYLANAFFWTKFVAFLLAALLSIVPTIKFIVWRRALARNPGALPAEGNIRGIRRWMLGEAILLATVPVSAAALALNFGAR